MCGMRAGDNQALGVGLEQTIIRFYKACILSLIRYSAFWLSERYVSILRGTAGN